MGGGVARGSDWFPVWTTSSLSGGLVPRLDSHVRNLNEKDIMHNVIRDNTSSELTEEYKFPALPGYNESKVSCKRRDRVPTFSKPMNTGNTLQYCARLKGGFQKYRRTQIILNVAQWNLQVAQHSEFMCLFVWQMIQTGMG